MKTIAPTVCVVLAAALLGIWGLRSKQSPASQPPTKVEIREVIVKDEPAINDLQAKLTESEAQVAQLRDELTAIKAAPVLTKEQAVCATCAAAATTKRATVQRPQRRAVLPWRR